MFRLTTIQKSDTPFPRLSDAEENQHDRNARIGEQARGEMAPDPALDLPKYVNQAETAANELKESMSGTNPDPKNVRSKLQNIDGVAVPAEAVFKSALGSVFLMAHGAAIEKAVKPPANPRPRQSTGRFGTRTTFDKGGEHEIEMDDIGNVSAGKGGLHVEHKDGSKRVIPPEKSADFLTWHGKHAEQRETAAANVDPDAPQHMTFDQSIAAINSDQQNWLTGVCADVDKFTGLKSQALSAIGVWADPESGMDTENALFAAISKVPDAETLRYSAALKGLAANQTAVLNVTLDPKGVDALYHMSVPHDTSDVSWKGNLQRLQAILEQAGVASAVFVRTPHGTDVVVFEHGGMAQAEALKQVAAFCGATGECAKCTGEFIGASAAGEDPDAQQESADQIYRSIVYQFEKQRGVKYDFKELPPEDMPKPGPMPRQAGGKPQKVAKSLGGLSTLRTIHLTRNESPATVAGGRQV